MSDACGDIYFSDFCVASENIGGYDLRAERNGVSARARVREVFQLYAAGNSVFVKQNAVNRSVKSFVVALHFVYVDVLKLGAASERRASLIAAESHIDISDCVGNVDCHKRRAPVKGAARYFSHRQAVVFGGNGHFRHKTYAGGFHNRIFLLSRIGIGDERKLQHVHKGGIKSYVVKRRPHVDAVAVVVRHFDAVAVGGSIPALKGFGHVVGHQHGQREFLSVNDVRLHCFRAAVDCSAAGGKLDVIGVWLPLRVKSKVGRLVKRRFNVFQTFLLRRPESECITVKRNIAGQFKVVARRSVKRCEIALILEIVGQADGKHLNLYRLPFGRSAHIVVITHVNGVYSLAGKLD